jgi:hypothetical protein
MAVKRVGDHEMVTISVPEAFRPYDRLVLKEPQLGRWIGTVLECERSGDIFRVTAIRCLPACRTHRRRR